MPLYIFLGIVLVLLSLFHGCSREDKEEHAGSDISLPPETFRIVSFEPEDAAEQVSIKTALSKVIKESPTIFVFPLGPCLNAVSEEDRRLHRGLELKSSLPLGAQSTRHGLN